ncbi:adhesion G protein-coupled receptor F5-like isoform X2 [Kryptolebias marmoratus]|uniref:adhesion G protein-coupled receptor F5-like isoform X2 n=1 Tax=Kryptolebias marmoratus TaxID=37003 RepID=UPI0018ACD48D|nr:adhesion G protein-coupled receptor F5-like isoform X2 [Kryptolebias marmoratus]
MAIPKTVQFGVFLLVLFYSLDKQGFRTSVSSFFEEFMGKMSNLHGRDKRAVAASANATEYTLDIIINLSNPESLRLILNNLSFPILINNMTEIASIDATMVCSSNMTEYQCICEENYAWSFNNCITYGACDPIIGDTCGCINGLPADQFCQQNTSQKVTMVTSPTSTPTNVAFSQPVDIDVIITLNIPVSSLSNAINLFRFSLGNVAFPLTVSQTFEVIDVNFTTACSPTPTELQCQCESGYAWPCDMCGTNNSCNNVNNQMCTCINGLPSNDQFCQPITGSSFCSVPTSDMTTTTAMPISTSPPPPPDPVKYDLVFELHIPVSSGLNLSEIRNILKTIIFPVNISQSLTLTNISITTVCSPTPDELQCQCEDGFAWPCDTCMNNSCSNLSSQICSCVNGLPANEFCQPITSLSLCPKPSPVSTTTAMPNTTSTHSTSATTPSSTTITKPPTTTTNLTTTTKTTTTTTTTNPPASLQSKDETFRMNLVFNNSYNEKNNRVYKDVESAIEENCKRNLSENCVMSNLRFSEGSTIADYTISAPNITDEKLQQVRVEIFSTLVAKNYPMEFVDTTKLEVNSSEIFFDQHILFTCTPKPELNFGNISEAVWIYDGTVITDDTEAKYTIDNNNTSANLTVKGFYRTDDGTYECRLTGNNGSVYVQRGTFSALSVPLIKVNPRSRKVGCSTTGTLSLVCSVNDPYKVEFVGNQQSVSGQEVTLNIGVPDQCRNGVVRDFTCRTIDTSPEYTQTIRLEYSTENFICSNDTFGNGPNGSVSEVPCVGDYVGGITATCFANGTYGNIQNNCIFSPVNELLIQSKNLNNISLPGFLEELSNVTVNYTNQITESPATIVAIVEILSNVANTVLSSSITISEISTQHILETAGILTINRARKSWEFINQNDTKNSLESDAVIKSFSSSLLNSFEIISTRIQNDSLNIPTAYILFEKNTLNNSFTGNFNSSVEVNIPEVDGTEKFITVILFASMDNVLPTREEDNSSSKIINGRVALIQPQATINNITLTFEIINDTLGNPKCVFWDFTLSDGLGGWSSEGCSLVFHENETVSCNCNHTTSFSILMSPYTFRDPILDFITYIGVGISMGSLVICLIIEAIIWRKIRNNSTSYLRHVSIVNIALSLLIADIWFIIGAAISDADKKNPPACTAATFFIHFFYLALFFWMLASALLLLYRTVSVFDGGLSKISMLIIGFCLGYGAPLIIATITIAVTAPSNQYIRENTVCWLNWNESKALLAFVIPALMIVVINLIVLVVVLYKMLRRRVGASAAQAGEKHVLVVIARSLAVLTPFFGITWGLGIGTLTDPKNRGIHIAFAFFNSLQGFFILVFGTLLDSKVRSGLAIKSLTSQGRTRSTSGGTSSSGLENLLRKFKRKRGSSGGYNTSSGGPSASNDSYSNT